MATIQSLIDPKIKKKALDAMESGDTSAFDKTNVQNAAVPVMKLKLSPEVQAILNAELIDAAKNGEMQKVKQLLDNGADVNAEHNGGVTALMTASLNGRIDIAKLLIDKGADVNARDEDGVTALMVAYDCKEVAELLISKGAYINARDEDGATALMWASNNGPKEIVEFLKQHGAME